MPDSPPRKPAAPGRPAHETATAHRAWDSRWRTETGRADWLEPDPDVVHRAKRVLAAGGGRALDLGCGVGRHALVLAELGFATSAIDGSEAGIRHVKQAADAAGLALDARIGSMTDLPFADAAFDYVLAYNVIYHGDGEVVRRTIAEIRRVLRPEGIYQGTMLAKENVHYGQGAEIAPDTFVLDGVTDKAHPHFYCDAAELRALFAGFRILALESRQHGRPGFHHWHLIAERRP